jgi:hypothetical protein
LAKQNPLTPLEIAAGHHAEKEAVQENVLPFLSEKNPIASKTIGFLLSGGLIGLPVLCTFKCRPDHKNGKADRHKPESVGRDKRYGDEVSQDAEHADDEGHHPNHLFWS